MSKRLSNSSVAIEKSEKKRLKMCNEKTLLLTGDAYSASLMTLSVKFTTRGTSVVAKNEAMVM